MVDGHRHDVVMTRHLRAVLRGQFVGRAEREAAAVDVEHDRALAGQARRPDVHLEHVLALPAVRPLEEECLLADPVVQALRAVGAVDQRRVLAVPRRGRLGRQPAILAAGRGAVRHALEREHAVLDVAAHLAVLRLRDGRTGRAARARGNLGLSALRVGERAIGGQHGTDSGRGGETQQLAAVQRQAIRA